MRKQVLKLTSFLCVALAVALFAPQRAAADDDDPPSRVARLSFTHGNVSFNPAGTDDWVNAVVNRPMTTGDKLWSDDGARAELHLGSAVIRLSGTTGFSFLNLTDQIAQLRLTEGTVNIRVRRLGDDETFEIDTPNLAFNILRPGRYRINVNEAGDTTIVSVRDGQGEVTGGGSAYTVHPHETGTFAGSDTLDADVEPSGDGDQDDFDNWCSDRDRREDHSASARYVSDEVIGYEDLDEAGGWRPVPEYGTVWFPHTTIVGWAPYRYGHWAWIAPWGWTWVDDAPWGFAPFHYGRWVVVGGVWGWVPAPPRPVVVGAVYVRPVYAPALVAFVGGPHWGVGVAVGGGGGVGVGVAWFPLGPRDVYCPSYHVSQTYVTNVNVSNTVIVNRTQVTNVYTNVYVNKTVNVTNVTYQNQAVSGAVTATSHTAFTSAQPVGRNMVAVNAREVATAQVAPVAPSVAPPKQAVLGAGAPAHAMPPAALANRAVVAKTAPPPAPVSFVKQQQMIQANGGRPVAISEMHQQAQVQAQTAPAAHPAIKMAPPATQAMPQNRAGNAQANSNRPNTMNAQGNASNQANKPANMTANPGNPQGNAGNNKNFADRPPVSRPNPLAPVNPQVEQKQQQQVQDLRLKQDQERQKIEQQQVSERQKLAQQNADAQRQAQLDQKHQQQLTQLEQKHDQQEQKLQQKQAQERQKQQAQPKPQKQEKPSKEEKPHKG
jgi:hypothetical protein